MKFRWSLLVLAITFGLMLTACSKENIDPNPDVDVEPDFSTDEMVEEMLSEVEQQELIELNAEQVEDFYGIDVEQLEEYTVRVPMMNVKTNEIALLKVTDEEDIEGIEESVKERAEDVQRQFENYLPDQYENAKNYTLKTNGKYILFTISEDADPLVDVYEQFFEVE